MTCCRHCGTPVPPARRSPGIVGWLLRGALLWALLVFGAGTLVNTGHPVAVELGRLIQVVTFVDPAIYWLQGQGFETISHGLRVLSDGAPMGWMA